MTHSTLKFTNAKNKNAAFSIFSASKTDMTWRTLIGSLLAAALTASVLVLPCNGCLLPSVPQAARHGVAATHCAGKMQASGGDEVLSSAQAGQCPQSLRLCTAKPISQPRLGEQPRSAPIPAPLAEAQRGALNAACQACPELILSLLSQPPGPHLLPAAFLSLRI
jgi:hypothetical protein